MKNKPVSIDQTLILLTPSETARRLSISVEVMERRIKDGAFPAPRRIGRNVRFYIRDIDAYAASLPLAEPNKYGSFNLKDYHDSGSFADRIKTHEIFRKPFAEIQPQAQPSTPPDSMSKHV
ncbi:MAG: helix-turn-helix domain-containing protein [Opitutaceae bacterium]|nr:helix-turn-helix domain-containing protein [Opitutaceae bacterium]